MTAAGHAEVRVDGALALMRDGLTTNGTGALGDQTDDPNLDSRFELYQPSKLCP